jgi:hypothetical protein
MVCMYVILDFSKINIKFIYNYKNIKLNPILKNANNLIF